MAAWLRPMVPSPVERGMRHYAQRSLAGARRAARALESPPDRSAMYDLEPSTPPCPARPATATRPDGATVVERFHGHGRAPVLLICDHAGRRVPAHLDDLGLPEVELARHIGWDIGAADMTRHLARRLDAAALLCHVSRLVIDPNRVPGDPSSILPISDGTFVPGNQDLSPDEVRQRLALSFVPYHRAVAREIACLRRRVGVPVIISMHSFTPRMGHTWRPWQVAVLSDRDRRLAEPVLAGLRADAGLQVGDNEPYSGHYPVGYSVPFHAARTGLPHVSFEVRQDLIDSLATAQAWADRLAEVLRPPLADPGLYRLFDARRAPPATPPV
jgi:predicted N-formylglutamate amidohydrolase